MKAHPVVHGAPKARLLDQRRAATLPRGTRVFYCLWDQQVKAPDFSVRQVNVGWRVECLVWGDIEFAEAIVGECILTSEIRLLVFAVADLE
jgi:hypothetical protein